MGTLKCEAFCQGEDTTSEKERVAIGAMGNCATGVRDTSPFIIGEVNAVRK